MQLHMCSQSFIALPPRSPRLALLCAPYEHVRRAQPGVRPLLHSSSLASRAPRLPLPCVGLSLHPGAAARHRRRRRTSDPSRARVMMRHEGI
eukprot:COSAG03_NODE_62_length_15480_cov_14.902412_15_plen_92_part_00